MKKGDVGMVKHFSTKYGNKGRAFNYLQSESYVKILSVPDATFLHHCLQYHHQYFTIWPLRGLSKGDLLLLSSAFPGFSSFMWG